MGQAQTGEVRLQSHVWGRLNKTKEESEDGGVICGTEVSNCRRRADGDAS